MALFFTVTHESRRISLAYTSFFTLFLLVSMLHAMSIAFTLYLWL